MSAFYNENDPKTAAWLRELIKAGLIAPGIVDERSITEIKAHELDGFTQCHFFAGIGGWSYALRLASVGDGKPLWTGSCPCQPLSGAGQRKGHADERHLWPDFYDRIAERRPAIVIGEQVASPDGREWLAGVRADMEGIGYAFGAADLCAAGVKAPHPRQRLFWVAHSRHECGRRRTQSDGQKRTATANYCGLGQPASARPQGTDNHRETTRGLQYMPSESGSNGGLGYTNGTGSQSGRQTSAPARFGDSAEPAGGDGRMGYTHETEGPRHGRNGGEILCEQKAEGLGGPSSLCGFWDSYDICHFTGADAAKTRRIEPGTFPLADGIPERMGLLRGYGNAINPQIAAVFIEAAMSCIDERAANLEAARLIAG